MDIQFHQGPTPQGCPLCDYVAGLVTEMREEREAAKLKQLSDAIRALPPKEQAPEPWT